MSQIALILAVVAMAAVAFVLVRGLWNMMKGGDPHLSNRLMQMRIFLQLVAIVLIVATIWLTGGGH